MSACYLKKIVVVLLIGLWCTAASAQLNSYQTIQPDQPIDFTFVDANGKDHKISEYRGKIVLVNFWATWCPPCVTEMPSLKNLADTFPQEDVAVITLCKEMKLLNDAKKLFENLKINNLPLFFDEKGEGAALFKVKGLPSTYVLDRQGHLIGKLQGGTEWDHYEVLDLIQNYMDGKTPKLSSRLDRIMNWFKHLFDKTKQ